MRRLLFFLFAWSVLALGSAFGVPARPLFEPEPPLKMRTIDLRNTTWIGTLYAANERVIFHADGTLSYGGIPGSPGVWKLTGNQLYFEINKWSEYHTVVEGDVIKGSGTNKNGQKCQPLLKRVSPDKMQEKQKW